MPDVTIGAVDRSVLVFVPDPAQSDGSGKTGLVAANLTVSYTRMETDNDAVVTDVTSSLSDLAALTTAHTDWGWKEISNTLAPGLYRLDVADAVFASGAWYAVVYVMITTSAAAASPILFTLIAFDPLDAVRLGLTALPNAAAGANGGLPLGDASGRVDLGKWLGTAAATPATAGIPDVNVKNIDNDAASAAGTVTFPGTIASPTNITAGTITTATNVTTVNGLAAGVITATSIADDAITDSKVASDVTIASVTGAVGSVTGAVGSVTGNVGGNVTGSVGSVVGAVGSVTGNVGGNVTGSVGSVAAGGIVAASFAANAITAAKLDPDVTTEFQAGLATQASVDDLPTNAELATALGTADDAVLAAIAGLNNLSQANVRTAIGLATANLDTQLDALPTNAELATALGTADDAILAVLGTPAGASVSADIAAIEAQTDDIGVAGAGLTALASAANLSTVAGYLDTEIAAILAVANKLDDTLEDDGGTFRFTANALEESPSGGGSAPTAVEIADEVETRALTLTSGERNSIAAALLDLSNAIETGVTLRGSQRLMLAALAGKLSGSNTTTITIRNAVADSKNRLVATVTATGDRTAISSDMS